MLLQSCAVHFLKIMFLDEGIIIMMPTLSYLTNSPELPSIDENRWNSVSEGYDPISCLALPPTKAFSIDMTAQIQGQLKVNSGKP